ncbi:unnamed protein product [Paramecium sonneborni]|uniref:Uncharacterized protein n=1 Tax=Paramecium sonneborni TaxID=65129 RepID=A0A8S1M776_9CILI|nr:unnamed protein product [Paramecium sonneborni]
MNDTKKDFILWLSKERNNQFTQFFSDDVLINLESQYQISKLEKISMNNYQSLIDSGSNIQFHKVMRQNVQEINQNNKIKQTNHYDCIDNIQFCLDQNERIDLRNFQQTYTQKQPKQEFIKEEIPLRKLIAILK